MSCYRQLLIISWVDMVTNEEVLNLVKDMRNLYASIKRRRDRLIRHKFRNDGLAGTNLEGTVHGKNKYWEIYMTECSTFRYVQKLSKTRGTVPVQ